MAWSPTPASPGPCSASGNPEAIAGWPMPPSQTRPALHSPGQRQKPAASQDGGVHASRIPARKIIHWRCCLRPARSFTGGVICGLQESMACRESICDRPDTGHDNGTGGYGRMPGQAFSPRRSTRSSRPRFRLSARFRSSARRSRAEDPVLHPGEAPRDRRRCRLRGSTLSRSVPARLTCQAAADPPAPPFGHIPGHAKGPLPAGKGP